MRQTCGQWFNRALPVYVDADEFFRKTSMTVGLRTVLSQVAVPSETAEKAGIGWSASKPPFGGGKTHILIALWHLAKHASELKKSTTAANLREALKDRFPEKVSGVAVFTNETCDATQGRFTPEGVHTRTMWGELALQLGGKELYEKVRPNDETQRVPQGLFADVLRAAAPCLILLDELADYCVGAASVQVGDTTLADQTIFFIQQLTEAVHQVPEAVVVATLPASKLEVPQSEKGQEAFVALEKRFQRLGADIKPVAEEEIYDVVRARLYPNPYLDAPVKPFCRIHRARPLRCLPPGPNGERNQESPVNTWWARSTRRLREAMASFRSRSRKSPISSLLLCPTILTTRNTWRKAITP